MAETTIAHVHIDSNRFLSRASEAGAVIVDVRTGECWELNRLGARVWDSLRTGKTVDEVIAELAQDYPAQSSRIFRDVAALVDELQAFGISR